VAPWVGPGAKIIAAHDDGVLRRVEPVEEVRGLRDAGDERAVAPSLRVALTVHRGEEAERRSVRIDFGAASERLVGARGKRWSASRLDGFQVAQARDPTHFTARSRPGCPHRATPEPGPWVDRGQPLNESKLSV